MFLAAEVYTAWGKVMPQSYRWSKSERIDLDVAKDVTLAKARARSLKKP